jgi:hypothetical protein
MRSGLCAARIRKRGMRFRRSKKIRQGSVNLTSVVQSPFGLGFELPVGEVMSGLEVLEQFSTQ